MSQGEYIFRPLGTWPRPETPRHKRKTRPFKQTLSSTYSILDHELYKLAALIPIVIEAKFSEREIRNDGKIRADARRPSFPGIILSFETKRLGPLKFLCDDCVNWEDNLRAIALTLERLRMADIYGVTKRGEQYTGWKQLPGAILTPPPMTVEDAAAFIAKHGGFAPRQVIDVVGVFRAAWLRAVKALHPDTNGQQERPEWKTLQDAKSVLDRHHAEAS